MGLDITAFEKVTLFKAGPPDDTLERDYKRFPHLYVNDDFPTRSDGMVDGHYAAAGKVINFRAGSYSGYNHWRDQLCHAAHGISAKKMWEQREQWIGKSFYELIDYSDCEGFIGPMTSAKLARDFAEHESAILAAPPDEWFAETYRKFRESFELASGFGVVEFH